MTFESVIRYARHRRGISARALSKAAGLSDSYVSKMEAGNIKPNLEAYANIARELHLNDRETLFLLRLIGE
jgi:transcriptional regulator with XRE-family HTH domain